MCLLLKSADREESEAEAAMRCNGTLLTTRMDGAELSSLAGKGAVSRHESSKIHPGQMRSYATSPKVTLPTSAQAPQTDSAGSSSSSRQCHRSA